MTHLSLVVVMLGSLCVLQHVIGTLQQRESQGGNLRNWGQQQTNIERRRGLGNGRGNNGNGHGHGRIPHPFTWFGHFQDVARNNGNGHGQVHNPHLVTWFGNNQGNNGNGHGQGHNPHPVTWLGNYQGCRGMILRSDPGTIIQSPNYPDTYGDNLNCRWLIQAPEGSVIDISFNGAVNIEPGHRQECTHDYLNVYDGANAGAPVLASICGIDQNPGTLTTTGHIAFIQFRTNIAHASSGFSLTFTFREESAPGSLASRCSGVVDINLPSGTAMSPGYPTNNYGDFSSCGFRIEAPAGSVITIQFTEVQLEYEANCLYDAITLHDGGTTSDPIIAVVCGSPSLPIFRSTGNWMFIRFISDLSVNDRGFAFKWNFVKGPNSKVSPACGQNKPQILELEEVEFSSHGYATGKYYINNLDCAWRIIVSSSLRAHLHFMDFELEAAYLCRYDQLYIYDGYDSTADQLGLYCGDATPGDITGSGNVLYVVLKTDSSVTAKGFHVKFSGKEEIHPGIGGTHDAICGVPSIEPKFGRIVGGQDAVPHSWPWQISIRNRDHPFNGGWGHWCGGSIIHPDWVVTAAHCVKDNPSPEKYRVIVGDHSRVEADRSQVIIAVAQVIKHESYGDGGQFSNDIALFKLASSVNYASEVSPICLPSTDIPDRTLCVSTGWGGVEGTAGRSTLQQVQVPVLPRAECNQADWYGGSITQEMVCAGYPEGLKDSCQGDSGGPLVCSNGGAWTLHGVISWGYGCAEAKKPGVYTRVSRFVDWIEYKTGVQF